MSSHRSNMDAGIKVGVQCEEKSALKIFNRHLPIADFVAEVVHDCELTNPENYMLALSESESQERVVYITEENREMIKDASILRLVRSPVSYADEIMTKLSKEKSTVDWNIALKDLHTKHLQCVEFFTRFVERKGHERLLNLLGSGQWNNECETGSAQTKTLCYQAGLYYNILMSVRLLFLKYGLPGTNHENGMVSWALINDEVLNKLISGMRYGEVTLQTLECCYDLLDHCIKRLPDRADFIVTKLEPEILFSRLNNELDDNRAPSKRLQLCLVKFLNTIFRHAKERGNEVDKVCKLLVAENRDIIKKCIPALRGDEEVPSGRMLTELVELQQHLLCRSAMKCVDSLDPSDAKRMNSLNMMRSLVYHGEISNRLANWQYGPVEMEHFRALGFEHCDQPHKDFDVSRGGLLAFECVDYFLHKNSKEAEELLSQKSSKGGTPFPFVQASCLLTNILAKKFKMIGDLDSQTGHVNETDFFPFLFNDDNPFEHVFSKCITTFSRTWRDMRATLRDVEAVRTVMSEQLTETFSNRECRERLPSLESGLQKYNYAEILRLQNKREEEKRKNKALSDEIRRCVKPQINELILENRINYMQKGSEFILCDSSFFDIRTKVTGGNFHLFLRLSPNRNDLYYEKSDTVSKSEKTVKDAKWSSGEMDDKKKISMANVVEINYGSKCIHGTSKKGEADQSKCRMTLIVKCDNENRENTQKTKDINLIAKDIHSMNIWMDGLNALRDVDKRSSLHDRDFERLASLEVQIRSLHLPSMYDVTRPSPPIPPEPPVLPV